MLGNIIFARKVNSTDAPLPFIVVGIRPQYNEGTTFTVVSEHDNFAFETLDIFVSSGYCSNGWEILGVMTSREYVENAIKRVNGFYVENALQIEWTEETVATAIETIRALERAAAAFDPPIDEEFAVTSRLQGRSDDPFFDPFLADDADTDDDTVPITDEEMDEIAQRVDAERGSELADAELADARAAGAAADLERHMQVQLRRIQQHMETQRRRHIAGEIPVVVIEIPNAASYEAVMRAIGGVR